jgi:succinate dehydrogenase / fumarate reductase, cytochrome b subunit
VTELPGAKERAARGRVRHKGIGPAPSGWLDPRGRALGGRAFALNRVTGLALVLYLYLHLGVLSILLVGESAWDDFLGLATSSFFLGLDVVLLAGLLFHGLNGIRVALVGSGVAPNRQRALFWAAAVMGTVALAYGAFHVLGAG